MFLAFIVGDAFRMNAEGNTEDVKKCIAEGISGGAEGMSMTWGSAKAVAECGPTRPNANEGLTYEYKFTEAFSVSFEKKCDCKIEGNVIVSFQPITVQQARVCAGIVTEDDPHKIKRQCWEAYMRGRGTEFNSVGEMNVPEYKVPWLSGNFRVGREGPCEGTACDSIVLPGVLEGKSREHKRVIGDAIKKIMDGQKDKVPRVLLQLIAVLPPDALDDAEFQQIDENNDGTLDLDELSAFYPQFDRKVIEKFIKEVDDKDNGTVDPDKFSELKKKMRDYNPNVDLIYGEVDFVLSPSGEIREAKPEWKVATVVCMKGGKPAPGECEDNEEVAIHKFNTDC